MLELMALGCPDTTFPRVGLFNWGAKSVHAAFMILCRAEPKTSFRSLLNRDSKIYNRSWAAQVLFHDFQGLYPDESKRREVIVRLRGMCYERQDEMIREAETLGLDTSDIDDKTVTGRTDSRNGNACQARLQPATGGSPGPPRELARRTTEEEIQRLERKQRLLQMTRELQRDEAALARGWAGGPRRLACPRIRLPLRQRPPFVCLVSNEMQALLCMELAEQCRERPKNSSSRSSSCRGSSSIIRQLQHHQAAAAVAAACCCLPFCSLLPCFLLVV